MYFQPMPLAEIKEVAYTALAFIVPALAIGAGLGLIGWGVFEIISRIQSIRAKQAAKPADFTATL